MVKFCPANKALDEALAIAAATSGTGLAESGQARRRRPFHLRP